MRTREHPRGLGPKPLWTGPPNSHKSTPAEAKTVRKLKNEETTAAVPVKGNAAFATDIRSAKKQKLEGLYKDVSFIPGKIIYSFVLTIFVVHSLRHILIVSTSHRLCCWDGAYMEHDEANPPLPT
jgi:hypothetical protein